jgi:hypothetical protein
MPTKYDRESNSRQTFYSKRRACKTVSCVLNVSVLCVTERPFGCPQVSDHLPRRRPPRPGGERGRSPLSALTHMLFISTSVLSFPTSQPDFIIQTYPRSSLRGRRFSAGMRMRCLEELSVYRRCLVRRLGGWAVGVQLVGMLSFLLVLRHCWGTLTAPCIPCVNNK